MSTKYNNLTKHLVFSAFMVLCSSSYATDDSSNRGQSDGLSELNSISMFSNKICFEDGCNEKFSSELIKNNNHVVTYHNEKITLGKTLRLKEGVISSPAIVNKLNAMGESIEVLSIKPLDNTAEALTPDDAHFLSINIPISDREMSRVNKIYVTTMLRGAYEVTDNKIFKPKGTLNYSATAGGYDLEFARFVKAGSKSLEVAEVKINNSNNKHSYELSDTNPNNIQYKVILNSETAHKELFKDIIQLEYNIGNERATETITIDTIAVEKSELEFRLENDALVVKNVTPEKVSITKILPNDYVDNKGGELVIPSGAEIELKLSSLNCPKNNDNVKLDFQYKRDDRDNLEKEGTVTINCISSTKITKCNNEIDGIVKRSTSMEAELNKTNLDLETAINATNTQKKQNSELQDKLKKTKDDLEAVFKFNKCGELPVAERFSCLGYYCDRYQLADEQQRMVETNEANE